MKPPNNTLKENENETNGDATSKSQHISINSWQQSDNNKVNNLFMSTLKNSTNTLESNEIDPLSMSLKKTKSQTL